MMNARVMCFRQGNLFKEFTIEGNKQKVTGTGRAASGYFGDGIKTLKGCLAEASNDDRVNRSTSDHIVTHTIVQSGSPAAKSNDKLILGSRVFYIVNLDDCGGLGITTLYYVEERTGVK